MLRNQKHSLTKRRSTYRRAKRACLVASLLRKPRLEMLETRVLMAAHPLSSIPVLNSNASAAAALYLDFNGHFEANWGSYSNITTPVFDTDGDSSTFSDDELSYITDVWKIVAEDFAPFNINVTTVEPTVLAPGVPASQANGVALRLAIGGTSAVTGEFGIAGQAVYNSFTNGTPNLALIFPESSPGSVRPTFTTGQAASHEAGHSFGLRHQPNAYDIAAKTQGIMNTTLKGYEDAIWSLRPDDNGLLQDDMAMLSNSLNGFGYRMDDLGGSISNATPLVNNNGTWIGSGIIGSTNDVDMFSFTTLGANGVKIDVQGSEIGQNLDVVFDFLDGAGNVIATANPSNSLDATLILPSSGTRYVAVRSTGVYGRVGQYTVSVSAALPGVEVVAATSGLATSEQGLSDTFTVRLKSKPAADVTISMSSSDESEGIISPGQIVFTADNWYLPQTVVVTGVDDSSVDGISVYSINFDSVVSADSNYAGISIASLQATNSDNDVPGSAVQLVIAEFSEIKTDSQGNLLVTGQFTGTRDFDPGEGIKLLTAGSNKDGFIAKYSPTYELIWAKSFAASSSNSSSYSRSLDVDSDGNMYVAGLMSSPTTTFGNTVLTSQGLSDAYLTKLNSNGDFLWARGWGGTQYDSARQVRIGANGNVIVAGRYQGSMDANPGSGTFTLTSAGGDDSFISQFSRDGTFISSTSVGGAGYDIIQQLEVDGAGNIFAAGYFTGSSQIGNQILTSTGADDRFLVKMNPSGSVLWARQVFGDSYVENFAGLGTDANGSVYLATSFKGNVSFGPNTPTLSATGNTSSFIAKWDSNGTLQRADQLSGNDKVSILGMKIGGDGRLNLVGYLQGTADLDPGSGEAIRTSSGVQDSFILRLDSNYQFIDEVQIARASGDIAALDVDKHGNVIVAGSFGVGGPVKLPTGDVFDGSNGAGYGYLLKLNIAAGVTVGPSVGLVTSEDGTSTSFHVVLDIPPTANVTIPVSSSNLGEGVVSTSSLTFTPANWNVPQTVTITGVDDSAIDGAVVYSIVLGPATSADRAYDGFNANDLSVTNTDNEASTKFYVVNDASTNRTYEYAADGSSIENYAINSGNSAPRGAASTAAGTTVWVADKNRKVYVYDTAGALRGSWTASTLASNAQVEGLATNGTDVWIVDNRSDKVYRYTNAAGRLSGSQTAVSSFSLNTSNTNPKGIVTDGMYLWVVNDSSSDKVFKYTLSGSLVGSWTIDARNQTPTGLTIDPANGSQSIWIVDSGTDRVYEYAGARSKVSGSQAAGITFALASGNSNPQGIADPPPPSSLAAATQRSSEAPVHPAAIIAAPPSLAFTTDRVRYLESQVITMSTGQNQRAKLASPLAFTDSPDQLFSMNTTARSSKGSSAEDADELFSLDAAFETIDDGLLTILAQQR